MRGMLDKPRRLVRRALRKTTHGSKADDEMPPFVATVKYTRDILKGEGFDIGEFTYGCPTVFVHPGTKLKIGKFTSIAQEVKIHLGGNHRANWCSTYQFRGFPDEWPEARFLGVEEVWGMSKGDVVIGNDVWIGYGVQILSGVTIGDGAIVGAGAVVASDIASYSVVVGNPATYIKSRFDEDTIRKLLELRWWDWPVEKIRKNLAIILSDNVKRLCQLG